MIAAQRVPPSAFSTSQSSVMVISPIAARSTTARKAAADQALDFLGAAGLLAARGLAVAAGVGGARQHAVFGGHPALAGVAQERRHAAFDAGGAKHLGVAHADQAGALGMAGEAGVRLRRRAVRRRRGRMGAWAGVSVRSGAGRNVARLEPARLCLGTPALPRQTRPASGQAGAAAIPVDVSPEGARCHGSANGRVTRRRRGRWHDAARGDKLPPGQRPQGGNAPW